MAVNAVTKFIAALQSLVRQGLSKQAAEQFAKNEFGEISKFLQKRIDDVYKNPKGEGIESIKIKDEVFDDTVIKLPIDDTGQPFNPNNPLKEYGKPKKAGKGQFTKAEYLIQRLKNTIKENPDDKYVQENFPNFVKEIEANPDLAKNENVFKELGGDLPNNQKITVYDDDTLDFARLKPTKKFQLNKERFQKDFNVADDEVERIIKLSSEDQQKELQKYINKDFKERIELADYDVTDLEPNAEGGRAGYGIGSFVQRRGNSNQNMPAVDARMQNTYEQNTKLNQIQRNINERMRKGSKTQGLEIGQLGDMYGKKATPYPMNNPDLKPNEANLYGAATNMGLRPEQIKAVAYYNTLKNNFGDQGIGMAGPSMGLANIGGLAPGTNPFGSEKFFKTPAEQFALYQEGLRQQALQGSPEIYFDADKTYDAGDYVSPKGIYTFRDDEFLRNLYNNNTINVDGKEYASEQDAIDDMGVERYNQFMSSGGRAGYYTGGMVDVEPSLSDIGHGSDALMARTRLVSPGSQSTTSTGLNYLLAEDNDNIRVPFNEGKTYKQKLEEEIKKRLKYKRQGMEFDKPLGPEGTFNTGNPPKVYELADGGRIGFSKGKAVAKGLDYLMDLFKPRGKTKFDVERFREGPIDLDFLENIDKKDLEPFIRSRDTMGPGGYGMYDDFADMPSGLQAAELISRIKGPRNTINYEAAEMFIGKKLKGNESVDELIEMLIEKKAEGGRIGFSKGKGVDLLRRGFLKTMGAAGAGIAALKSGILSLGGKQATKEVAKELITTPAAAGKPPWFDALVTRVIREGDDVTKTMATKDREIVYRKKIDDETEVMVTQDLDEGVTRIDIDDSTRNVTGFDDPPTVSLQVTDEIVEEGGQRIKPEFKATENDYRNYATDPDGGYETEFVENTVENTKDLTSDLTKVKSYATNKKETMKEFVESKKRKDNVKYANENPSSYAADRGPDYDPSDYIDDMADDYASGGIAQMIGE